MAAESDGPNLRAPTPRLAKALFVACGSPGPPRLNAGNGALPLGQHRGARILGSTQQGACAEHEERECKKKEQQRHAPIEALHR